MSVLFHIRKVLIVSPTFLKYQWKGEIEKFTNHQATVIEGVNGRRADLYEDDAFYKLVNYELVWRDMEKIRKWAPDLIILDEAQRIKNWKTRTAKYVKQLQSPFAFVLTGTPIENRIEELHSLMEFIDRRRFGPLYRFVHNHRVVDESGKVIGYQNLDSVKRSLEGIMIRRKKDDVLKHLPARIDKHFFVPMTKEQQIIHDDNYEVVVRLVAKWRRYKFLSEADQLRMQIALSRMRMASDNTYLVDKKTVHGPKIDELAALLSDIMRDGGEKVVIFSQWLRMTELVEGVLNNQGIKYVHLNGSVPSRERKGLMTRFRDDADCKVFLSTDAGGVGLNLQSGSVVINMDIPWNPAILEQRIGRVHRIGQRRLVRVINFVTKASIEERILELLKFKKSLFAGALDESGQDVVLIGENQLQKFMKTVEAIAENLDKADPVADAQEEMEAARDSRDMDRTEEEEGTREAGDHFSEAMDKAAPSEVKKDAAGLPLNVLLLEGAKFLTNLSNAFAQSNQPPFEIMEKQLKSVIEHDEATGKTYVKIPIPAPEVLQNIFTLLGGVLANIVAKR